MWQLYQLGNLGLTSGCVETVLSFCWHKTSISTRVWASHCHGYKVASCSRTDRMIESVFNLCIIIHLTLRVSGFDVLMVIGKIQSSWVRIVFRRALDKIATIYYASNQILWIGHDSPLFLAEFVLKLLNPHTYCAVLFTPHKNFRTSLAA